MYFVNSSCPAQPSFLFFGDVQLSLPRLAVVVGYRSSAEAQETRAGFHRLLRSRPRIQLWTDFSLDILLLAFNWVGIKRDSSFFFHLFAIQVIHVSFCLKAGMWTAKAVSQFGYMLVGVSVHSDSAVFDMFETCCIAVLTCDTLVVPAHSKCLLDFVIWSVHLLNDHLVDCIQRKHIALQHTRY